MKKVLAADIGFRSTGMAIFQHTPKGWKYFDSRCIHTNQAHSEKVKDENGRLVRNKKGKIKKHQLTSVAVDDVRRIELMGIEILNYFIENQCQALVCEIPGGGAQNASAQKCMGLATGMIAMIHVALRCPMEHISPGESRAAAGWIKKEHPMEGLSSTQKKTAMKAFIMAVMEQKYLELVGLPVNDKEHIADACATFEAARGKELIKLMGGF